MPARHEFDFDMLDGRALTPEQWDAIKQYAVWRANAERARLLGVACRQILAWLQVLAAGVLTGSRRAAIVVSRCWKALAAARARRVAIAELQSLDDRMLKDIGVCRGEIPSIVANGRHDATRLPRPRHAPDVARRRAAPARATRRHRMIGSRRLEPNDAIPA